MKSRGFIVHSYADFRKDRLFLVGRLEDGRSFAAVKADWRPSFHIFESSKSRAVSILSSLKYEFRPPELESFDGKEKLLLLRFFSYRDYGAAGRLLARAGIPGPDSDLKIPEVYAARNHIRGPVELEGEARAGRILDLVFPNPHLRAVDECGVVLKTASVDIETDVDDNSILAIGTSFAPGGNGLVRVLGGETSPGKGIFFHTTEAELLNAFIADMVKEDPDIITGWNFLDFDFPRIAERCAFHRIPFNLGRSGEEAKYFPPAKRDTASGAFASEGDAGGPERTRRDSGRTSAAALVPGRQVLDAMRICRSSPRAGTGRWDSSSFTLEAVARAVLGEGKLVASSGAGKIAELKALYRNDPVRFGEYCLRDAELVLSILEKTGLLRLTVERASLTGVSLDKAWTSVASFERVYGTELRRKGIAPAPADPGRPVSGAAGGTVLDPLPGLFRNVAVFDFRSLYPTIMLSFNIDPLARARALSGRPLPAESGVYAEKSGGENFITAPNGAVFSRERGILPALVAGYFAARRRALDAGDEEASFVYKILMNSFYGVLGTPSCRYAHTELAGAITSFARKWLHFSRDWFTLNGCKVLYGDTDSLFVETGFRDESAYGEFLDWGKTIAGNLNKALGERVAEEYGLASAMELRFEKIYRRFMIPPLRNTTGESRGRAKGYGGYLLDPSGGLSVEVKGMEAVRSDYTPLARRIQPELLELVFSGAGEREFKERVDKFLEELRKGKLDGELVYRKRLSRNPESYTSSTPPQVKAARALGWKNRRGVVEYVWTINGPEPSAGGDGEPLPHSPLDYDHYAESQILPAARSIAAALGWELKAFSSPGTDFFRDGQMELNL